MTVPRRRWTALAGTLSLFVCLAASLNRTAAAGAVSPAATAPTVTINQASFQADPTKGSLIYFTVKFSAPVTGFTAGDISLAGSTTPGDLTAFLSGSGPSYTVWIGGMTGPGKVVASIPAGVARDSANNLNLASTSTDNSVTYKPVGPNVTINQGATQSDPTNTSPIVFDVVFSSSVTGFDASDISFAGSTIGGTLAAQVSGTGANYTVSVTGMAGKGTLLASIPAGAASDSGNHNSFASSSVDNAVSFDNVSPAVTINQAATQSDPALTSPVLFTVSFSEPVTGFTASDVSFAGSTAGGTLAAALSGAGQTYTLSVTGMTTSGSVIARIPAGAVADGVGNPSTASSSTDNTVMYSSAPAVTINQSPSQADPTATSPITFTVVFSLPVTGFTGSDISFAGSTVGGTLAASVTGSGASYTVSVTGMTGSGTVLASVPAGAAFDAANKPNVASTSTDNSVIFDTLAPTVSIDKAPAQSDPTAGAAILFAVTFSESVTGFTAGDVSLAGGTAGGALAASVSGSGANYTVSVAGMTSPGNVVINVLAGAAQDQVGNASQAATIIDNTVAFDNVAPAVAIDQAISQVDPTGTSPIVFTVTFTEPVTGFSGSDLSFAGSTAGGALTASVTGGGANYTVSVTGMTTTGNVIASIPAGAAQDIAGNSSQGSSSTDNVVSFDNVAPTVVINQAATQSDPTSGTPIVFSVTFSESVTGFDAADVSLVDSTVGGTLQKSVTGSGANYSVSISGMSGDGAVVARVSAGAAIDAAGNSSGASTSTDNVVTYLPTGATVTINQGGLQPDPTNASPVEFAVVFSAPVTGFDASDISFAGSTAPGSLTASVTGSGANYSVSVTGMSGAGIVTATIPAGRAFDGANNPNQASTSVDNHVTFDNLAPTVTINQIASQADPTNVSPIAFAVTFSEPVSGFTAADVSFAGSGGGNALSAIVSGSGANYTVSVSGMTTTGAVVASIPAGAATDSAGNASAASTSTDNSVFFDNLGPTVTVNQAAGQTDPASTSPIRFSVEFSESVAGFTSADVSFAGSTVAGTLAASVSGSGASYTINVTGMSGSGTVAVSIPAGAATDLAGNASTAATSADGVVTYLPLGPTVTINQMPGPVGRSGQPDPTNASPILFNVVFSAAVTGFTGADVNFAGSTVGGTLVANVSGTGTTYTVSVTGMSGNGTVVTSIPADAAIDTAGTGNRASTSTDNTVMFDTTPPSVTINQAPAQADPTNGSPIQFSVAFSESVVGFNASDVSLAGSTVGGTLVASVTGSGANYTVSVTGMSGTGIVTATIPAAAAKDAAGNNSLAATSTDNIVTFGLTGPSVTINQAAGQPDPANGSPIQFAVSFSSPVTGFDAADVNLAASTVGGTLVANVAGSGAIYTVLVTGMTGTGTVVASIRAGAGIDGAGAASAASSSTDNTVTFDNIAPAVTINQAAGQNDSTNASPIQFTVAFTEPVTGFTGSDVSFAGSTVGGTLAAAVSGSGANYTVSVTGMTGTGVLVATIPAGAAIDAATNASTASTSTDNSVTYDATGPSVTINQDVPRDPTNASLIVFGVVFSEPVTGFTAADISFAGSTVGGTLAAFVSASPVPGIYDVAVTGMTGTGNVVASIPAGAAIDAIGNPSQASTSTDNVVAFDNVAPTVTINQASGQADPTNASPIQFSVVFSEPVTGFTGSDVSFAGSTVGGTLAAAVSGSGTNYTVSVTGMTSPGAVVATIPAGAATDAATNASTASTSTDNSVNYNATGPTVTINQAAGQADPTNASPIQFAIVFSAPVTGFNGADIDFTGSTVGGTPDVASVTGSGANYSISVTGMTGPGNVVASIPAGAAIDALGNPSQASTSTDNVVAFDNVAPTVTINQAAGQADPTNTGPIQFTVVFSEPVTGFTASDVSLAGSTVGGTLAAAVSGSGTNYTVSVTGMTSPGAVVATIPAGAATDAATNASTASTSTDNTVLYNATGPSVTINRAAGQNDPTNTSPIQFSVVFSTAVTGFDATDISFAGSTNTGTLVASVTPTVYPPVVSLDPNYSVSLLGRTTFAVTGGMVYRQPTNDLLITDIHTGLIWKVNAATGAISLFADAKPYIPSPYPGGWVYELNVSSSGEVFVPAYSVPLVLRFDSNGTFLGSFATPGPTYTAIALDSADNVYLTTDGHDIWRFPKDSYESPTLFASGFGGIQSMRFDASDHLILTDANGYGSEVGKVYQVTPGGLSASAHVLLASGLTAPVPIAIDALTQNVFAGNNFYSATDNNIVRITSPGVYSTFAQGFGAQTQAIGTDPFGNLYVADKGANTIWKFAPRTSLTSDYTVFITGMSGTGTVVASITAGAAIDAIGNPSQASTSTDNVVAFDNVAPTVTINQASGQADPTNASPIQFSVVFSEPVTGFTGSDVSFAGSTVGGTLAAAVSGSGTNYTVSVTGMTSPGAVVATIPAGAATDAATNASTASTSTDNTVLYNATGPSVTINQDVDQRDPTNGSPIVFAVVFSAPVTGFTASDVSFAGSSLAGLAANVLGSGANYTVTVTGMTGTGTVVATIPAGAAIDALSNPSQASTSTDNSVAFDNVAPTVTINQAAGQPDPTNGATIQFTAVFSENVSGFTAADVSLAGSTVAGTLVVNVSGGGTTFTVSVTGMSGNGTVVASIPAGAAQDAAGNVSTVATSTDNTVTHAVIGPTVTINQAVGQPDPTNASPIQFTVVFSASVTGFTAADISFATGTLTGLVAAVTGSGTDYSVTVTGMSGTGTVRPTIVAGAAIDAVGNPSLASSSADNVVTFDNVAPTVTINQAAAQADPTNASPIVFNVVFSEPVTGFITGDVVTTGSTVGGTLVATVTGSGASYVVSITGMTGTGNVVASIPGAAANDQAGNPSDASTSTDNTVAFNNVAPTVTINQAAGQQDPTNASPVTFTVVFSAPVTGFVGTDVNLANSTAPGTLVAAVSGSGAAYSIAVTGMTAPGTVVASIPAGAGIDAANNASQASTSVDNTVTFDNVVPTVTINQASGQNDPTNASPILFGVVFSEPVIGFAGSDVSLAGSTVGGTLTANVSGSGANYTVSVTGMNGSGTVVASIPAASATDPAGNPNPASTSTDNSVNYNAVAPTVTINQAATQPDPTNTLPIVYSVLFSSPVTGFTGGDVSFAGTTAGGTPVASVTGSGSSYLVSVSGITSAGTVVVSIPAAVAQDEAGNLNQASTSVDNSVAFDNVAPTVTINQAAGQADPTNVSPVLFTVTFSEPVTGFTASDVLFTGSSVGGTLAATVSGSGANYTVSVTGMTSPGAVVAIIAAGAANDLAGNASAASTSTDNSVTYNATGPSVAIDQAAGQADPTNASPIQFTVVFSAAVTGFTASDISFAGSTVGGLSASVTGTGANYTVSVTGMTGTGIVVASIPAGAATDSIGNASAASASTDNIVTFDNAAPTVTINQAFGQADPTNASPIQFTVVFSEPVTGFTPSDVSFSGSTVGGTLVAGVSGSGAIYTVSVTGMTGIGAVTASIPAGAAIDLAGNVSGTSTSTDNTVTYNAVAPFVTINQAAGQQDPTNILPIQFSVVFGAPVTGFTASDVSFTGSSAPGIQANVSGSGTTYTVSVTGLTGSGLVVVSIPAGAAIDNAGNLSQASTSTDNTVTYDVSGPRVVAASPSGNVAGPIDRITVVFDEAIQISSFTPADVVSLTGPGGAIVPSLINARADNVFDVIFPSQTSGTFTLVIGPDIRDLLDQQMDQNVNGINGEPIADRYTTTFTIVGPAALTSVAPSTGQQGTTLDVVVNGQSTNFVNGVTTAGFSGTGISVNSVTVSSPTSATLNISISSTAIRDQRSVTLTTNTEVVSSSAAGTFFTVTASPATITTVIPNQGNQGAVNLPVAINGFATHFANGTTTVSFGSGIGVNSVFVDDATKLTAHITIDPSATPGLRDIVVTTAGEIATGVDAFTVIVPPASVASVSPATGRQNETLTVQIIGQSTHFDDTTTASFGAGISAEPPSVTSATSATVEITIDKTAAAGARTVVMQTGSEIAQKVGAFTVQPGIAILESFTPVAGVQGTSATLVVRGLFTHFIQDATQVSVGPGISVGQVTVNGPELASAPISITEFATTGPRTVTVMTSTPTVFESVSISDGFNVLPAPPEISVIDPNAAQRGLTLNVTITGRFTNWQNGVTHATYGSGITVNSNIVTSPTQLTTNITIDPAAALAPRDVVVTTGSEVLTVYGGLTVIDVDITAPTILTVSPAYFSTNVPLNVLPAIEWSEPLSRSTVNTNSIQLWDSFTNQLVPGSVQLDATGRIVTLVPGQLLAVSRTYYLYLGYNGQIRDVAGNPFTGATYYFVTGFATDTTGPTLLQSNPANGDTGVPTNTTISLQFDRPINAATRASGLQILNDGVPVPGVFTFADGLRQINFAPAVPWEANATYTIALTSALIDIAGNALTNPGNRTFTAGGESDTVPPQVIWASPVYGDVNVGLRPVLRVVFNERVNPISINAGTFYLYNSSLGAFVPTTFSVASDRLSATMTPDDPLDPFTTYVFQFFSYTDVAGNFGSGVGINFTTGASVDTDPPTVASTIPADGATNVPINALVRVTMSEMADPTSISDATLQLAPATAGTLTLSADRKTLRFALAGQLTPSTTYTLNVNGVRDLSGNVMAPFSTSFTTSASAVADTTLPTVINISPASGATNVPVTSPIVMTLSEPIEASQVGSNSMRVFVNNGSVQIGGTYTVTNSGTVATFIPSAPYPVGSVVWVYSNYDGSITDFAGNQLAYLAFTFTTAGSPTDTTAPVVEAITPPNGATEVGPQALITLTISESMTPANDYQNFAVFAGGVQLGATIGRSADNRMVILSGSWPLNTVMSVVATAGNTDLSGNHLVPFSSTFTTAASFDSNRPSIVTQLPMGSGVAPTTPVTLYSNKALVDSTVHAALYVSQNGVLVDGTITVSGGGTAINFTPAAPFAANAVIQVFLTADAKDTFGNTVTPYSGSFTIQPDPAATAPVLVRTSPINGTTDNPVNSIVEVELSEPLDAATVTTSNVQLRLNGVLPATAGSVTLDGNRIRFTPAADLQPNTYYSLHLFAGIRDIQGTPIAETSFYFYTGTQRDTIAPSILSIAPANGFTGVGVNATVRVRFSEPINPLSVTPASVTLSTPAGPVPVTFVISDNNTLLRIVPENPLPVTTVITLSIDPYDVAGNELPAVQSQFTTAAAADTTAPLVVNANWTYLQTVPVNAVFEIVFNEAMDAQTVLAQRNTFLYDARYGGYVAGTLVASADARTFTFTPSAPLAVNRPYSVQVYGALDLAGNASTGFTSYATTDYLPDTAPPTVADVNPTNGATGVPRNAKIRVLFSEPIAVDNAGNVRLLRNGSLVSAFTTVTNGNRLVTLTPNTLLASNTVYTISVSQVRDVTGNLQPAGFTSTFTTGNDADLVIPVITRYTPSYAQSVPRNVVFRVAFSEPIDPITIDASTFFIYNPAGQPALPAIISISSDGRAATLRPEAPLLPDSQYIVQLSGFADPSGNLGNGISVLLNTTDVVDENPPAVTSVTPANGTTGVPVNARVVVVMNESIEQTSVSDTSIQLSPSVPGTVALGTDQTTLIFTPSVPLATSTAYTVHVNGLRDLALQTMAPFASSFVTSSSAVADTTPPIVLSMLPVNGAAGVAVNSTITFTTNEAIIRSVVGPVANPVFAFLPIWGAVQIAGTYSVDASNRIVTFTPATPYPANTTIVWYTNYTGQITDAAGNALQSLATQFTTGATADVTAPTLVSFTPADGATDLGPLAPITLTFSESISPATSDYNNVALFSGSTRINVGISRSNDNRMIFLSSSLTPDTTYTFVATSGIQDLSGNAFAGFSASFTTAPFDATRPNVVTQRPTGSGVSPGTSITLFVDSALAPSTVPAATFVSQNGLVVPGTVTVSGSGRTIVFTPAAPFQPGSVVEIAITSAATDPSRNPLFPYFGTFTVAADPAASVPTLVAATPVPFTINNPVNVRVDVEFSEALNPLTVTNDTFRVQLNGVGAPVEGALSLLPGNRIIHFVPATPLQADSYYSVTLSTGIQDTQGTAYASTNYYFYTGSQTDSTIPMVTALAPANGTTGVGINAIAVIRFNEPVNVLTVNSATVTLTGGGAIPFVLSQSADQRTFTITPQLPLPSSTPITLSVNGVKDAAGNVAAAASTTFTTGPAPDTVAPSVLSFSPVYNDVNVPVNAVLQILFNEAIDPASAFADLNTYLYDYSVPGYVQGGSVSLSADLKQLTYTPPTLVAGHSYQFYAPAGLTDLSGNPVNTNSVFFVASTTEDTSAPSVLHVSPPALSGVPRNAVVEILFDEPIRQTAIDSVNVLVAGNPVPIAARTLSYGNRLLTLTLPGLMAANTVHTISIAGVRDGAGNTMPTVTSSFTTGIQSDLVGPDATVVVAPVNGAVGVSVNVTPTVRFSEVIDPVRAVTVSAQGFGIFMYVAGAGIPVDLTYSVSADFRTVTATPTAPLQPGTQYQLIVYSGITDLAGNPYPIFNSITFTTQ